MAAGGAFMQLLVRVLQRAITSRLALGGGIGYALQSAIDDLNLGEILDIVEAEAPEADKEAKEDVSRLVVRLMQQSEVLWPVKRSGERILPKYFILNINHGSAFYSSHYYSKKSLDASFKKGRAWGNREALRKISQENVIHS